MKRTVVLLSLLILLALVSTASAQGPYAWREAAFSDIRLGETVGGYYPKLGYFIGATVSEHPDALDGRAAAGSRVEVGLAGPARMFDVDYLSSVRVLCYRGDELVFGTAWYTGDPPAVGNVIGHSSQPFDRLVFAPGSGSVWLDRVAVGFVELPHAVYLPLVER